MVLQLENGNSNGTSPEPKPISFDDPKLTPLLTTSLASSKPFFFTIGSNKREFMMHSALVASQSPTFERLVNNTNFKEGQSCRVDLENVEEETFIRFSQFAYTGKYDEGEVEAPPVDDEPVNPPSEPLAPAEDDSWGFGVTSTGKKKKGKSGWTSDEPAPLSAGPKGIYDQTSRTIVFEALAQKFVKRVSKLAAGPSTDTKKIQVGGRATSNPYLLHAKIFVFADYWGVTGLKEVSLCKLSSALQDVGSRVNTKGVRDRLVALVEYCYNEPRPEELLELVDLYAAFRLPQLWSREMASKVPSQRRINVYVRWRPLAASETESCQIDSKTNSSNADGPSLLSVSINRQASPIDRAWASASSFDGVLDVDADNHSAYQLIVANAIPKIMQGGAFSVFAYGHSGSGKTHTIIGYDYDNDKRLGLALAAARSLFAALEPLVNNSGHELDPDSAKGKEPPLGIGLSLFEVRRKTALDLLNHGTECHIREGPDGKTHIRGETELLGGGKVRVCPIVQQPCWAFTSLREELIRALSRRAVGSSTVHDQSSRTHAVLEFEVVSQRLIDARQALYDRQSELVPVGKRATDISIEEQSRGFIRGPGGTGWVPNPDYQIDQARIDAAEAEKAEFEARVAAAEVNLEDVLRSGRLASPCLGGKMVFVDLAGAEYHREKGSAAHIPKQTPQEQQEGRQINADLLALKEVIRAVARSEKGTRIPFRASPLTMVLREHFRQGDGQGDSDLSGASNLSSSAMVVTVSPAREQFAATLNSLKYGSLVGAV
ncbi:P-loop containing nucleoside triphosphate hydrolase protein [Immersiella caudata]|uniref:Kinesin-like protein n=1 Tax=Immersiella caudata TaxID=314043 RepID=A0AA39WLU3_9PEZI|nr:P-loop containing nucleoside triphosphate hydrolase protein [Immersiella caudata]